MLTYCVANPAGNRTVLVTSPVKKSDYAHMAQKLMARIEGCEQVGFLTNPLYGGDIRLEMMGGEFCGNALRCAAYYHVRERIPSQRSLVATEISGCDRVLTVFADVKAGVAEAEMVLPRKVEAVESCAGKEAKVFHFDGISHIVTTDSAEFLPEKQLKADLYEMSLQYGVSALGLMNVNREKYQLTPVVYVRDTDTMVYESSCASGTAAAAMYLALSAEDGIHTYDFEEPGGSLTATVVKEKQSVQSIKIGGAITMTEERQMELE